MASSSTTTKDTKDAPKEPTLEDRVTALEAAVGMNSNPEVAQTVPAGPPAPHELYVAGDEEE